MKLELLDHIACTAVPHNGRLIHASAQQPVPFPAPLQAEDGTFVLSQRVN